MALIGKALYGKKWAHDGLGSPTGISERGQSGPMVSIGGQHLSARADAVRLTASHYSARRRPALAPRVPLHLVSRPDALATRLFSSSVRVRDNDKPATRLTHIDAETGRPKMVSVTNKQVTSRTAKAGAR